MKPFSKVVFQSAAGILILTGAQGCKMLKGGYAEAPNGQQAQGGQVAAPGSSQESITTDELGLMKIKPPVLGIDDKGQPQPWADRPDYRAEMHNAGLTRDICLTEAYHRARNGITNCETQYQNAHNTADVTNKSDETIEQEYRRCFQTAVNSPYVTQQNACHAPSVAIETRYSTSHATQQRTTGARTPEQQRSELTRACQDAQIAVVRGTTPTDAQKRQCAAVGVEF